MTSEQSDEQQPRSAAQFHDGDDCGNSLLDASQAEPCGSSLAEMLQQHMDQLGEGHLVYDDLVRDEPLSA